MGWCLGPGPGGRLGGLAGGGGLQAHTRGDVGGVWSGGGLQAQARGGAIPACTEADGYCRGRYASYWNAFLFNFLFNRTVYIIITPVFREIALRSMGSSGFVLKLDFANPT